MAASTRTTTTTPRIHFQTGFILSSLRDLPPVYCSLVKVQCNYSAIHSKQGCHCERALFASEAVSQSMVFPVQDEIASGRERPRNDSLNSYGSIKKIRRPCKNGKQMPALLSGDQFLDLFYIGQRLVTEIRVVEHRVMTALAQQTIVIPFLNNFPFFQNNDSICGFHG